MDGNLSPDRRSARIVAIDDDCDVLAYLVALLARHGFDCAAFWRPDDALEYIRTHPVSVVLTDVFMPEVDGIQLISAIKDCCPEAMVVGLSGYNRSYLRCMKALGAFACITKPIDPDGLMETIEQCLEIEAAQGQ